MMQTYARIQDGVVMELIAPRAADDGSEIPIADRFHPAIVANLVSVPDSTAVVEGWLYEDVAFAAPSPGGQVG